SGEKVTSVVNQDIDSAKLRDGSLDCFLCIRWASDVEFDCQQIIAPAEYSRDLCSIATGGDDGVAGGQGRFGDIDAQTSASAGNEPNFLFRHDMFLIGRRPIIRPERCPANLTPRVRGAVRRVLLNP